MKTWVYSWVVYPLVYFLAVVVGIFSQKVRETLRLRSWKHFLSLRFNAGEPIEYWVHVASHGEMEYAVPLLEELARRNIRVLVTYYSISAKNPVEKLPAQFPNVSLVVPLPHDGLGLMAEFVRLAFHQGVRSLLLLKYELWPGLLWECNARGIKVYLVDALKPSWFHQKLLHKLDGILSGYVSEIENVNHKNIQVVGDTRVERVQSRLTKNLYPDEIRLLPKAVRKKKFQAETTEKKVPMFICGSMWPEDSEFVLKTLSCLSLEKRPDVVWVPHEIDLNHAKSVSEGFKKLGYSITETLEFSDLSSQPVTFIVKKKGILAELYRLGDLAFVGGGFGKGVHSVWEPAIAGCKVSCGPRTKRSPESQQLKNIGWLEAVSKTAELQRWLLANIEFRNTFEMQDEKLLGVLKTHQGAATRIIGVIEEAAKAAVV